MSEPNGSVSYTVKELLARVEAKIDSIAISLAAKAERGDMEILRAEVALLKLSQAHQKGSSGLFWKAAPLLISGAALCVAILVAVQ